MVGRTDEVTATPAASKSPSQADCTIHTFLNSTPATDDHFGGSVAISGDKVLISAWYGNTGAEDRGAAYLFSSVPTSPK